ncbi:hypothetical protein K2173_022968 [Erythroxylum novogranatense]|uniref:DNA-directed RNA polymerase n=1 Tax=Erythroxylum novogranatense TaxID=1862640 RepID=A0AAV8T9P8_9ROSI|nr:hypothetical protein K2173_022968 [Erythroxylum novogranatense]
MVSIGDEELAQMVTDYIESEPSSSEVSSKVLSDNPVSALKKIFLEAADFETQVLDKVVMYIRNMGEPNGLTKRVVMRLRTDGYEACLCKTCWVASFPKVFQFSAEYEYIDVMMLDKNSGKPTRLIVDMDFRSQFEVVRPTQTYKEMMNILPPVFVGTEERLDKIITLVCLAAKQSLKEKGLDVPPWRKAKYMHSKWLSKNYKKMSVFPISEKGDDEDVVRGTKACCPSIF